MTDHANLFSPCTLGAAALALSAAAMATDAAATAPYASVERATFHQLVFANDDVAILKNLYPPRGDSDYHVHPRDLFIVLVTAANMSTQRPGQPLSEPQHRSAGSVGYNLVGGGALTARGDAYVQIFDNSPLARLACRAGTGGKALRR